MLSPDVSLQDLEVFVEICRLQSLKEASRQMGMSPSVLSKVVRRLEKKFSVPLFTRTQQGMQRTPEGTKLYQTAKRMMNLVPDLDVSPRAAIKKSKPRQSYTVASISYISSHLVAPAAGAFTGAQPTSRFRIVEFKQSELVTLGLKGVFDLAVHIEPLQWTRSWHTTELGEVNLGLFGRYGHPLGTLCNQDQALEYPFVVPVGWNNQEGLSLGTDNCPVPMDERLHGNETATAASAIELIPGTDELTFVPLLSARTLVKARQVQQIQVQEWPSVKKTVYLSARADRITKRNFEQFRTLLRAQLV